jgi:hypothetical protein
VSWVQEILATSSSWSESMCTRGVDPELWAAMRELGETGERGRAEIGQGLALKLNGPQGRVLGQCLHEHLTIWVGLDERPTRRRARSAALSIVVISVVAAMRRTVRMGRGLSVADLSGGCQICGGAG